MNEEKSGYGYDKRPMWQWIVLYVVVGGTLYGLVYYFIFAGKGGYNYDITNTASETQTQTQATPKQNNTTAGEPTTPESASVTISNFAFSPKQLSVKAGTTVTWTNNDSVAHTVTSDDGFFESGTLNAGGTYSYVFPAPGTYNYYCRPHPYMTATVVVTQ